MSPVRASASSCSTAILNSRPASTSTPRALISSAKSIATSATPYECAATDSAPGGRPRKTHPVRSSRFRRWSSRRTENIRLHEDLAGVEYPEGVEGALDAAHGFDGRVAERHLQVGGFDVADAVLAADGAAAEVAEVDDEGVVLLPYRLDALDEFGHARARDDHVLVKLERPELLDG